MCMKYMPMFLPAHRRKGWLMTWKIGQVFDEVAYRTHPLFVLFSFIKPG